MTQQHIRALIQTIETAHLMQSRVASDLKHDCGPLAKLTALADGVTVAQKELLFDLRSRLVVSDSNGGAQ